MHHDVVAGAITESLTTTAKSLNPYPFTLVDVTLTLPQQTTRITYCTLFSDLP
jgi:hypothetical protein